MRSEQWIRTQKRRVRKKYRKGGIGNKYFSPKEFRDFRHGKNFSALAKALKNISEASQKLVVTMGEVVKVISEVDIEAYNTIIYPNCGIEQYNDKEYCMDCGTRMVETRSEVEE